MHYQNKPSTVFLVFHFYRWNQFKVILWQVQSVHGTYSQIFLTRRMRVDNTADKRWHHSVARSQS